MIEGTAGLVVAFILLTLLVQFAGAAVARSSAEAAVAAAARRAARPGAVAADEEEHLAADLAAALPGATGVRANVGIGPTQARASARFRWLPPGPDWLPLTIAVHSSVPRVIPP